MEVQGVDLTLIAGTPPWRRVEGKYQVCLPQMPPLRGGICMGVDLKKPSICPWVAFRAACDTLEGFRVQGSGRMILGLRLRVQSSIFKGFPGLGEATVQG